MKKILKISLMLSLLLCTMFTFVTVNAQEQKIDWVSIEWGDNYYQEKDLPDGLKGYTYPVPNCVGVDNHGNELSGVQVIAYAPNGNLVPIIDGRIKTEDIGAYQIIYAIDYLTFSANKTVTINVLEESSLSYEIHEDIASNYYTGQTILLPEGEKNGDLGLLTLSCEISLSGEPCELSDFGGVKYFKPQKAGVYLVKFELTDYVGQKDIKEMEITVVDSNAPIMSEPSIQKINRVGEKVKLPVVNAVLYKGEDSYLVPVKVFVDENEVTSNMEYVAALGGHVIKYVATNFDGSYSTEYVYNVEVVDGGDETKYNENYHYINNYFYLENFHTEYKDGACFLVNDSNSTSAQMDFATKVSAKQLDVEFEVDRQRSYFDEINYRLTDSRDSDKFVTFTIKKSGDKSNIYLNGEFVYSMEYSFANSSALSSISLNVNNLTGDVTDFNDNVIARISTYENGQKFTGFDSGNCYISIGVDGIIGPSALKLVSIANMNITDVNYEVSAPKCNDEATLKDIISAEINQKVILPYVEFTDPLDQNVSVKVSVTDPDGISVFNDYITGDIEVLVDKYGEYAIEYMATDSASNYEFRYAQIYVADREFPSISVGEIKGKVRVGDTIELPEPTVSDNSGVNNLITFVYIVTENSQRVTIRDYKYTFEKSGEYLIKYVVMDKAGNYSAIEYKINCR